MEEGFSILGNHCAKKQHIPLKSALGLKWCWILGETFGCQLVPVFRKLQQASLKIPVFSGSFLIFCRCFSLVLVFSMIFASHNVLFLAPSECLIHSKNKSFLPEWSSFSSRCHCEVINTKSRPLNEMWGAGWDTGHPYPGWMENRCLSALRARNIGTHSTAWL